MTSKVRVGIVGARFAARFHLEAYHKVFGIPVEVVGMTSKSRESREAFAATHGLKAFDSLAELLNAVDVVDICAPGYVHEAVAVEAFRAGKHVIIKINDKVTADYTEDPEALAKEKGMEPGRRVGEADDDRHRPDRAGNRLRLYPAGCAARD